jgi:hypothetical protein
MLPPEVLLLLLLLLGLCAPLLLELNVGSWRAGLGRWQLREVVEWNYDYKLNCGGDEFQVSVMNQSLSVIGSRESSTVNNECSNGWYIIHISRVRAS